MNLHLPVYIINYSCDHLLGWNISLGPPKIPLALVFGEQGEDPIDEFLQYVLENWGWIRNSWS
jgi:hypothetical protein